MQSNNGTSRSKNRKSSKNIVHKESRGPVTIAEPKLIQPGDSDVRSMFQQLRDQLDETGRQLPSGLPSHRADLRPCEGLSFKTINESDHETTHLVRDLPGTSILNVEFKRRDSKERKGVSHMGAERLSYDNIKLKNQQEIHKLVMGTSLEQTKKEPKLRQGGSLTKSSGLASTQKISMKSKGSVGSGTMGNNEIINELRNSAAKIVTDSKKRARATTRKFSLAEASAAAKSQKLLSPKAASVVETRKSPVALENESKGKRKPSRKSSKQKIKKQTN